ncbi:hypothetical protein [Fusobacterium necrophorum]|nr:hypothetical protein [Fusobacterium necrophorum]KID49641.1 hypothetical protein C095_05690 [Fusobacterium necrophorum subsp. funduliforme B35]
MKLVNINGGYSIGVYSGEFKNKVFKMISEDRIKYFAKADYTEDSELEKLIKHIINRTVVNEILEMKTVNCINEMKSERQGMEKEEIIREDLIDKLNESSSFSSTHEIIRLMSAINGWSNTQMKRILEIAIRNSQVRYILKDKDVEEFYSKIYPKVDSEYSKQVIKILKE